MLTPAQAEELAAFLVDAERTRPSFCSSSEAEALLTLRVSKGSDPYFRFSSYAEVLVRSKAVGDKWQVLEAAQKRLLVQYASAGVTRIEYVVGFVEPYQVVVWLGTSTDTERDDLAKRKRLVDEVAAVLDESGIGDTDAEFERLVAVESQETVDRDYEGSWFYRLR